MAPEIIIADLAVPTDAPVAVQFSKGRIMSEEPNPNDHRFSGVESVIRVLCVSVFLSAIVFFVIGFVIARIVGQGGR
jgi:hypothetical protein